MSEKTHISAPDYIIGAFEERLSPMTVAAEGVKAFVLASRTSSIVIIRYIQTGIRFRRKGETST